MVLGGCSSCVVCCSFFSRGTCKNNNVAYLAILIGPGNMNAIPLSQYRNEPNTGCSLFIFSVSAKKKRRNWSSLVLSFRSMIHAATPISDHYRNLIRSLWLDVLSSMHPFILFFLAPWLNTSVSDDVDKDVDESNIGHMALSGNLEYV